MKYGIMIKKKKKSPLSQSCDHFKPTVLFKVHGSCDCVPSGQRSQMFFETAGSTHAVCLSKA